MRVLVISQHYPPCVNGFAVQCAETARFLAGRGHNVRVLTARGQTVHNEAGVDVVPLLEVSPTEDFKSLHPGYLVRQLRRASLFRRNAVAVRSATLAFAPDVIFVWQFHALGINILTELGRSGVPVVLNVADTILGDLQRLLECDPNPLWRVARRYLYGTGGLRVRVARIIVPSRCMAEWYQQTEYADQPIVVIPNGIDARYIKRPAGQRVWNRRLLYAGRLHETKGVHVAIDALARLRADEGGPHTMDIVGSGPDSYRGKLGAQVIRLGLEDQIRFLGARDRESLMELYGTYDAILFPSVYLEPFGLIVLEGMARGIPVIASDRGGPSEIIRHMKDGLLVEPGNADALSQAVRMLRDDPALREAISAEGISSVESRFTLEQHGRRTEAVLFDVVQAGLHLTPRRLWR